VRQVVPSNAAPLEKIARHASIGIGVRFRLHEGLDPEDLAVRVANACNSRAAAAFMLPRQGRVLFAEPKPASEDRTHD